MTPCARLALCLAVLVLSSGCEQSGHNQNTANLRVLHAIVDAESLDVLVDDDVKTAAIAFGTTAPYAEISSGTRILKARSAVSGATLTEKSHSFGNGGNYTVVVHGRRNAVTTLQLTDDTADPSSGRVKVRVAGLSPDAGVLDLYIVTGDIASVPATLSAVGYTSVTDYADVAAGSYRIVLAATATKEVVFQSSPQALAEGGKITLAILPALGGKLVNMAVLTPAGGTLLANPLARMKSVNASPDSAALTFKADSATLLSNVPFMGSSSYVTTAAGARTLQLEAANAPGSLLATLARQLDPARDYSVIAMGSINDARLVALADDNSLPATGYARVRFANVRADAAAVDVLVNFASQMSSLVPGSASDYYLLAGNTEYTVTFATPGGIAVVAALETGTIEAGAIYTAYLFGTGASPAARLVRDR